MGRRTSERYEAETPLPLTTIRFKGRVQGGNAWFVLPGIRVHLPRLTARARALLLSQSVGGVGACGPQGGDESGQEGDDHQPRRDPV